MPLRRTGLASGSRAFLMAYVTLESMTAEPDRQRYSALEGGRRHLYEAVDGSFAATIEVDGDGLLIDYPDLFRRLM